MDKTPEEIMKMSIAEYTAYRETHVFDYELQPWQEEALRRAMVPKMTDEALKAVLEAMKPTQEEVNALAEKMLGQLEDAEEERERMALRYALLLEQEYE